jgi:hypothetical protein
MFENEHTDNPHARASRNAVRVITYRTGATDRIEAAKSKRERKAEKRARDAVNSMVGGMQSREILERGPRNA